MSNREKTIAKIRALMDKTVENGCTEAEAMSAIAMASKLMEEHDISVVDVEAEVKNTDYGARSRQFANPGKRIRFHESIWCATEIAAYWDCRYYISGINLVFFGSREDTDMAHAMIALIRLTIENEWQRHFVTVQRDGVTHGRTMRKAFMQGITDRIRDRLDEMKKERTNADFGAHKYGALVALKGQMVTEKYAQWIRDTGKKLKTEVIQNSVNHTKSYNAGVIAGNRVDLGGHKIDGGNKRLSA